MKARFARIKLRQVALVLVVIVIGLAVVAIVLPDSDETGSSAHQVNTDPAALHDTDPWFRKLWVRGCVASGESAAFFDAR
jgi:ABC-type cobalt transport system substrate-binding protein